ncbi:ComF family protein [Salinicoccus luteus]|uniref:ComF family protein n=1 Tax=Salinicoccus luteus TaxID=367840 RepID=UPI0004E12DCF|nr:ComF family protein [Salinicoccus luteus]
MICYFCHEALSEEVDIATLFKRQGPLCRKCRTELSRWREGKRCDFCHRLMQEQEAGCLDCLFLSGRFRPPNSIACLLDYNAAAKMLFHRYKFMGDCALAEVLAMFLGTSFREYEVIIPIPISKARMKERGYDQTTMVLDAKGLKYSNFLEAEDRQRQSTLSKMERARGENPFHLNCRRGDLAGKRILVIDDIYTTGMTVHQALEKLYTFSPAAIDVLTFSKA